MDLVTIDIFSAPAKKALVLAQQEAQRSSHAFIEIEHLLLGILTSLNASANLILQELGVKPVDIYSAVAATIQPANQTSGEIGLASQTKKVTEVAVHEMTRLRHDYLGTEHLLLGILSQEESHVCSLLHEQGVNLESTRAATERIHSRGVREPLPSHSSPVSQPQERSSNPVSQVPRPAGTPSNTPPIDNARQQLAITYARSRQRARSISAIIIAVLTVIVLTSVFQSPQSFAGLDTLASTGANAPVLNWQPVAGWYPFLVLLYFVLVSSLLLALSVPFAWYTSFVIPRRYGLRKGTTGHWLKELGQGLIVLGIQIWLLIEIIALLMALQPQTWWVWAALIQFLFSLLTTRFVSLRRFPFINKIKPLSEGELTRRLQSLLARSHLPACHLFHIKVSHRTSAANAFFTGWGNGRRIILTDTLTQNFTLDEIEVILAHELGHLVHHDIWTRLVMRGLTFLGLFYLISLYPAMFTAVDPLSQILPLIGFLLLAAFSSVTMRYRRHQEYQADEFALQATGNVPAFKSAMIRLTNLNLSPATSTRRTRHPRSHPTLVKRLQHADEFTARGGNLL